VTNTRKSLSSIGILLLLALGCFDTARAQGTLSASPSQLTFNTQSGVTTPSQTILLTSSAPASVTITPLSTNNWLVVTPSSGTTPLSLTVSVGATAPTSGTTVAYINATSSAGSLSIPVTLNANSGGTSPLTAIPNSLSFIFPPNSTVAATQGIGVSSSSSSVTTFTATGTTSNGGNWLTINPAFGPVPGSFQVTVNPSVLGSAGTFNAAVAINAPGTTGTVVPILVTLQGTPSLNVTPSQLSFGYQIGTSVPAAQTLSLTSSTGSNIGFSATAKTTTCGSNWIVLSQTSGATPSTLTVQVNTTGLTAGVCNGEIDIAAPSAANPSIVIPVGLLVSTSPLLQVPSTGPTFNYQIGSATPAAQNVQITSSTAGVNFTAAATVSSGSPNFLQLSPGTGTTPQALTLTLNATVLAGLGPGTYSETVTVSSATSGNSPQPFPVTLVVSSNPTLISSVPALNFNYQIGQATPQSQTLTVSSSGAPLNYQVSSTAANCSGFLSATPANGSTFGSQNQIVVSVNTAGLTTSQVCSGNVVLSVPGTSTSLQIPVSLNVSLTPLLNVSQGAINVTALAGSTTSTQQTISVTSTDNSSQTFSATASTSPVGLTWLSVAPNNAATPSNVVAAINPTGLAVGTYTGSIVIQGTGSASGIPAQTIPVTLTIAASTATAAPTSLTFAQSVGGSAPASQTIQINGVPAGATIGAVATVFNGSGTWLTASVSGSVVTVNANGSQLALGTYTGVITVIVPGALGSPLNVPVTLTVGAAPALSVSPTTVNFAYQVGTPVALTAQAVQVTSTGSNVGFIATFTPQTGGNFVTVTPTSNLTPATLNVVLNAAQVVTLAPGTYSGTIMVSLPGVPGATQNVTVNLTVTAGPTPVVLSVTNAGSLQPGAISPGEIITIFGNNIGPITPATGTAFQLTAAGTVPTTLAGVTVTINNVKAPLIFVSPIQINAIVPYEVAGQTTANVVISLNDATSTGTPVQVVPTAPSIFTLSQNGSGQGAILNQNGSVNGTSNPAAKGSIIQIFGTGEGQLVPAVQTGCLSGPTLPLPKPVATPITVTIGGQPATPVTYAGEAPTLVCGVIQIDATVPTNIGSGPQTVVVTIGSNTNIQQNVTVAVAQ
jgi:uncharacterized protein (TIGR03437 family)